MNGLAPFEAPPRFTEDAIEQQLGRIFLHPDFSNSEILRKFLSFVVRETCSGNANRLKEYTIAVKALEKPTNFNPQINCIVRIHAGRLRKALTQYYNEMDLNDEIIIGLPKGKYVPVFMDRQQWLRKKRSRELPTFAILPFHCTTGGDRASSFIDNLCLQICSELSQMKEISVIGYQAIKSLASKSADLSELATLLHFDHIICGGLQYSDKKIRVNIQVIECNTYQQIWSKIFECNTADSSLFDIQDEICRDISGQACSLTNIHTLPPKFATA
jgi:TolB-like protein